MAGKRWTEEELAYVEANYLTKTNGDLLVALPGSTRRDIQLLLNERGWKRPEPKVGDKFNMLTIVSERRTKPGKYGPVVLVDVECECGKVVEARLVKVVNGYKTCCGCQTRHHMSKTRLYFVWGSMLARCYKTFSSGYKNYGARGITVADEWHEFRPFRDWALANGYTDDLTIERKDVNGNYCPDNCCFATQKEQGNNRRNNRLLTAFGETKTATEWSEDPRCKTTFFNLLMRIGPRGWDVERAITTPPDVRFKRN